MGYIAFIILAVLLVPLVIFIFNRRPGTNEQGQVPIGKPVERSEPSADEPTPDASLTRKNTAEAQRRTPAA